MIRFCRNVYWCDIFGRCIVAGNLALEGICAGWSEIAIRAEILFVKGKRCRMLEKFVPVEGEVVAGLCAGKSTNSTGSGDKVCLFRSIFVKWWVLC